MIGDKCSRRQCKRLVSVATSLKCEECKRNNALVQARSREKKRLEAAAADNGPAPPLLNTLLAGRKRTAPPSALDSVDDVAPANTRGSPTTAALTNSDGGVQPQHTHKRAKILPPSHHASRKALINSLRLEVLRAKRAKLSAEFAGYYVTPDGSHENDRALVHALNGEILAHTGIRFTVEDHDNRRAAGLATTFRCSQDARRKQKARKTADPAKQRDNLGMNRFSCESRLHIAISHRTDGSQEIVVRLRHEVQHESYVDVALPPQALKLISEHVGIAKPADLLPAVHALDGCKHVSNAQVYRAWSELSQVIWRRDDNAFASALKLLEEYEEDGRAVRLDIPLPDGVTAIAWALPEIAERVAKKVKELAIDATYSTNSGDLELYGLLGEVDGFGVPLAYCLLSTASSIAPMKRRDSLAAFFAAMHDRYGLDPDIVLTDKDFAEIGAVRLVWPRSKHQLCYWHIRKATRERMASSKLSTAPYHPFEANAEFGFVSLDFLPRCGPDRKDPDTEKRNARAPAHHVSGPTQPPTRLPTITLPATQQAAAPAPVISVVAAAAASPQAVRIGHILLLPPKAQHRPDRWVLWARSAGPLVPRLKTTMICESHWRRIKVDFLRHFHKPRLDILIWILVEKLVPTYKPKLDALESDGRHRHRAAWRKALKAEFGRCARAQLRSDPEDSTYISDPHDWICTCPHFSKSRFLVCKHLVQACEPVNPRFFLEVPARNRTVPFWKHELLVPLGGHREAIHPSAAIQLEKPDHLQAVEERAEDDDDDEEDEEIAPVDYAASYEQSYIDTRHNLLYLLAVLDHNAQFGDRRFLESARARMAGAKRFAEELRDLQARTDSGREDTRPTTWGRKGLVRFLGFRTLTRERARELQSRRTEELRAAGFA